MRQSERKTQQNKIVSNPQWLLVSVVRMSRLEYEEDYLKGEQVPLFHTAEDARRRWAIPPGPDMAALWMLDLRSTERRNIPNASNAIAVRSMAKRMAKNLFTYRWPQDDPPTEEVKKLKQLSYVHVKASLQKSLFEIYARLDAREQYRPRLSLNQWSQSAWMQLLLNEASSDPNSLEWKRFVDRFRLPVPAFLELLNEVSQLFTAETGAKRKKGSVPLEIKLMITLRWLGRAEIFDTIAELLHDHMCKSTVSRATKLIVGLLVKLSDKYITCPTSVDEIRRCLALYLDVSLPGCIGSMDG